MIKLFGKENIMSISDVLPNLPSLRRKHAMMEKNDLHRTFYDRITQEKIYGNPDITHPSNQNLVELAPWQSGRCNSHQFFSRKNNDHHNDDPGMSPILECAA